MMNETINKGRESEAFAMFLEVQRSLDLVVSHKRNLESCNSWWGKTMRNSWSLLLQATPHRSPTGVHVTSVTRKNPGNLRQ